MFLGLRAPLHSPLQTKCRDKAWKNLLDRSSSSKSYSFILIGGSPAESNFFNDFYKVNEYFVFTFSKREDVLHLDRVLFIIEVRHQPRSSATWGVAHTHNTVNV